MYPMAVFVRHAEFGLVRILFGIVQGVGKCFLGHFQVVGCSQALPSTKVIAQFMVFVAEQAFPAG